MENKYRAVLIDERSDHGFTITFGTTFIDRFYEGSSLAQWQYVSPAYAYEHRSTWFKFYPGEESVTDTNFSVTPTLVFKGESQTLGFVSACLINSMPRKHF